MMEGRSRRGGPLKEQGDPIPGGEEQIFREMQTPWRGSSEGKDRIGVSDLLKEKGCEAAHVIDFWKKVLFGESEKS